MSIVGFVAVLVFVSSKSKNVYNKQSIDCSDLRVHKNRTRIKSIRRAV